MSIVHGDTAAVFATELRTTRVDILDDKHH